MHSLDSEVPALELQQAEFALSAPRLEMENRFFSDLPSPIAALFLLIAALGPLFAALGWLAIACRPLVRLLFSAFASLGRVFATLGRLALTGRPLLQLLFYTLATLSPRSVALRQLLPVLSVLFGNLVLIFAFVMSGTLAAAYWVTVGFEHLFIALRYLVGALLCFTVIIPPIFARIRQLTT